MSVQSRMLLAKLSKQRGEERPVPARSSFAFTASALLLATWLVLGAYVDAWAHHHLTFETFFTPWHALLYTGAAANTLFYSGYWLIHRRSLPTGYGLSLAGCIAFMVSGAGDLAWHTAFGVERDFAAILSPTHLGLMISAALIISGPFRAAWRSQLEKLPWTGAWSLTLLLAVFTFFMQELQPYTIQWANPAWSYQASLRYAEQLGVDNLLLATAALIGLLLLAMHRFELQPGQVLLLTAIPPAAAVLIFRPDLEVVVPLLAGCFGEALRAIVRPERRPGWAVRLYVVLLTAFLWGFYMWGLAATDGTWWPIHSEFGVVVVAAAGAWLLSYLADPPRLPAGVRRYH